MRRARRWAVSVLVRRGQGSAPSGVIRITAFSVPPMMPVAGETSFATIQSQPLRRRLAEAWATTSSVSAAKPTTRAGRPSVQRATVLRMSGFSANSSAGAGAPACFLILELEAEATRQSATAAAKTAASAAAPCGGRAASTAASISRALSTSTICTPRGRGASAGPVTKVTAAPRSRSALASAVPCAPEERLAM